MNFGQAIEALNEGARVARTGWNGADQWLILVPGSTITVEAERPIGKAAPDLVGESVSYRPHIDIFTVDRQLVPWIASQSDMLADDWRAVGPATFILNTRSVTMASAVVSYEEISNLANIDPARIPTVEYSRAVGPKTEGSLHPGESVEVGPKTIIDCVVIGSA